MIGARADVDGEIDVAERGFDPDEDLASRRIGLLGRRGRQQDGGEEHDSCPHRFLPPATLTSLRQGFGGPP